MPMASSHLKIVGLSSFIANNIPVHSPLGPSLVGIGNIRFAFVMRWKSEDSLGWRERAHPCTIGTFNAVRGTREKTLEVDGKHPRKGAFWCFGGLYLVSSDVAGCRSRHPFLAVRVRVRVRQRMGYTCSIGMRCRGW